ncbi:MAG: hypothetical protein NXI30_18140 [bacterium]|nr:hypothetical protein [bacterium]
MEREFSDEELRVLGLRSVDALAEALEAGDRVAALGFVKRLRREVLSMIRNYAGWEETLLSWVDRTLGGHDRHEVLAAIEDFVAAPERGGDGSDPVPRWKDEAAAIDAAIAAGENDAALLRARALHDEALVRHDRGMSRVSAILSWIGRNAGIPGIEAALGEAMSGDMIGNASFRERAEALTHFTRVHLQPVPLEEDDEKLTFACTRCPSGGRMIAAGHYATPRNDLVVRGPHPLTYGRDEIPVYCCHEPIMEIDSIRQTGAPLFVVEPAERLGFETCKTYLYKRPEDVPAKYYARLGLEKPGPGKAHGRGE